MTSVGIIVLAFNEVEDLRKTVEKLIINFNSHNMEIVISTSYFASTPCQAMANKLETLYSEVSVYYQEKPFVAAAILEVVAILKSDVIIYMSADGETPPEYAPILFNKLIEKGADIVSASRWIRGGSLTGYGTCKYLVSKFAQIFCKALFFSRLTEFTYGYRAYKRSVLTQYIYHETKHAFFLESLLVPIRMGRTVYEIPVNWVPRREGVSVVDFSTLLGYVKPIFFVRFRQKKSYIKQ